MAVLFHCPKCGQTFPADEFNKEYWCFYGDEGTDQCPKCGVRIWWEMRMGVLDSRGFRRGSRVRK